MAFAFRRGERVDVGARRLAHEGTELVLSAMNRANSDVGVHEARRTLKRLRALVRLIGPAIGDRATTANAQLRAAGRDFATSRDAAVMLATFEGIAGDEEGADAIRKSLRRARRTAKPDDRDAIAQIRAFAASIDHWSFDGSWASLQPGVHKTYRAGRRALSKAVSEGGELHEVRKRGKDLQFQLALLRECFPEVIGGYQRALRELGSMLGDEHDLAVLGASLARRKIDTAEWLRRIDERRSALRARALPLAARIWVDRPRTWTARLGAWWSA